jgi:hypothetical protein
MSFMLLALCFKELHQPDKAAVAEHSIESGHRIKFHETEILAKNIRLRGPTCQRSGTNKIMSGQYKQRGRVQTQQSMESQRQFIKALQHTHITKIRRRHREEHAEKKRKYVDNMDTRLSNTVNGRSRMGDHKV